MVFKVQKVGGDERNRTADPLLARQVLSQLSYAPTFLLLSAKTCLVGLSGLEPLTSRLSGVRSNQLSYKPKRPVTKFKLRLRLAFIKCHDMPRTKFSLRCRSSSLSTLAMEMKRFELSTPCLQGRCSPN